MLNFLHLVRARNNLLRPLFHSDTTIQPCDDHESKQKATIPRTNRCCIPPYTQTSQSHVRAGRPRC